MKGVWVMLDEDLLTDLDRTTEVREKGRSAVLRQLIFELLKRRSARETDARYERAYVGVEEPLGPAFEGWKDEGVWQSSESRRP